MSYPVGLPTVTSYTPNQQRMTFGQWLDKHEGRLEPGLWTATVSGSLPFEQDLVHSKLVKPGDIRKAARQGDDGRDIQSDFVLLRREVKNGVITADVLGALRRVATNAEWAAIRRLQLVTAAAYLKDDRVDDVGDWCDLVIRDRGEFSCFGGNVRDWRTRAWLRVPLEDFVGRLADRRKHYKALAKAGDPQAKGMDALLTGMPHLPRVLVRPGRGRPVPDRLAAHHPPRHPVQYRDRVLPLLPPTLARTASRADHRRPRRCRQHARPWSARTTLFF
jgi:hypothetical protein